MSQVLTSLKILKGVQGDENTFVVSCVLRLHISATELLTLNPYIKYNHNIVRVHTHFFSVRRVNLNALSLTTPLDDTFIKTIALSHYPIYAIHTGLPQIHWTCVAKQFGRQHVCLEQGCTSLIQDQSKVFQKENEHRHTNAAIKKIVGV